MTLRGAKIRQQSSAQRQPAEVPIRLLLRGALPPGRTVQIAKGVHLLPTSLPFRLRAVNLWLLDDNDSWTMVDCGYPSSEVRAQIEKAWSRLLGNKPIRRLIVTHHHPDHVGNCRWICDRWGIVPMITRSEYERAQQLASGGVERMQERVAFWRCHGLAKSSAEQIMASWGKGLALLQPMGEWHEICDGDRLQIKGREWQVLVASGHSPAQALLYSREQRLLIAGDQVLHKITPNVSVSFEDPEGDPLSLFLKSNRHLAGTCGDANVLPSHGKPFSGLQARISMVERHHHERLKKVEKELRRGPRSAASLIATLFGDPHELTPHEIGFAMGEAIAHLNYLVTTGRAERHSSPTGTRYSTSSSSGAWTR